MLSRRQFLRASARAATSATVTLVLAHVGCSSTSSDGMGASIGTTLPGCDGAGATSSLVSGHTHDVCVPAIDLSSPPAAGAVYTTTGSGDGHAHTIALTQAQLVAIAQGQTVMLVTTTTESHAHTFALSRKVAASSAPPQPGYY
jgi:hypothetical protein